MVLETFLTHIADGVADGFHHIPISRSKSHSVHGTSFLSPIDLVKGKIIGNRRHIDDSGAIVADVPEFLGAATQKKLDVHDYEVFKQNEKRFRTEEDLLKKFVDDPGILPQYPQPIDPIKRALNPRTVDQKYPEIMNPEKYIGGELIDDRRGGHRLFRAEKEIAPENLRNWHALRPTYDDQAAIYAQHAKWASKQANMAFDRASRDALLTEKVSYKATKLVNDELDRIEKWVPIELKKDGLHDFLYSLQPLKNKPTQKQMDNSIEESKKLIDNLIQSKIPNETAKMDRIYKSWEYFKSKETTKHPCFIDEANNRYACKNEADFCVQRLLPTHFCIPQRTAGHILLPPDAKTCECRKTDLSENLYKQNQKNLKEAQRTQQHHQQMQANQLPPNQLPPNQPPPNQPPPNQPPPNQPPPNQPPQMVMQQ